MQSVIYVLVIEDNMDQVASLKMALETLTDPKYVVESAQSLDNAILRLERGGIDVVLLDFHMPDNTGGEMLDKLKEVDPSLKVIVLTGWGETRGEAEAHGADDFLVKPVPIPELSKRLQYQVIYKNSEEHWAEVKKAFGLIRHALKVAVDPESPPPPLPEIPPPPVPRKNKIDDC
jgi:two-component system response regulator HydG